MMVARQAIMYGGRSSNSVYGVEDGLWFLSCENFKANVVELSWSNQKFESSKCIFRVRLPEGI